MMLAQVDMGCNPTGDVTLNNPLETTRDSRQSPGPQAKSMGTSPHWAFPADRLPSSMSTHFRSSSRRGSIVIFLLFLAVAYLFSFGPVQALYSSGRISGPMPKDLVTFYKPVQWFYSNSPMGAPMTRHDAWWGRQLKRS